MHRRYILPRHSLTQPNDTIMAGTAVEPVPGTWTEHHEEIRVRRMREELSMWAGEAALRRRLREKAAAAAAEARAATAAVRAEAIKRDEEGRKLGWVANHAQEMAEEGFRGRDEQKMREESRGNAKVEDESVHSTQADKESKKAVKRYASDHNTENGEIEDIAPGKDHHAEYEWQNSIKHNTRGLKRERADDEATTTNDSKEPRQDSEAADRKRQRSTSDK